jgi:hypothetical protein
MSLQNLIFGFAVILLIAVWYSGASLRQKIWVRYTRADNTLEEFLVPITYRYLIFDHKRFNIVQSCIKYLWYKKGVHGFFPTRVAALDFSWWNENPIDPKTGEVTTVSPTSRFYKNQEESMVNYGKAQSKVSGKKSSPMMQYLPIIAIAIAVLGFGFLFMKMQGINNSITMLAEYYKSLPK